MIAEITSAIQSVKILGDLLKAAHELRNYNDFVTAIYEVNSKLVQALSAFTEAQDRISTLTAEKNKFEQECIRLKDWSAERERYTRKQVGSGVFAYVENSHIGKTEGAHKYCCNCFDKIIKSTLQQSREPEVMIGLVCPNGCPKLVFTHYLDRQNS